jgi:hypothetical protein
MEFGRPADLEIRDTADLEVCATLVTAAPRCAVSQNCILPGVGRCQCARTLGCSADYKSAIRQITNLRYELRGVRCTHTAFQQSPGLRHLIGELNRTLRLLRFLRPRVSQGDGAIKNQSWVGRPEL